MRTTYLLIVLDVLAGCKTEDASVSAAISGIAVPANMSGIPSN
ncbi:hypothetical protein N9P76_02030 [Amylibacter sp.]|nr:hypothetical protein [Amylibacter sp.]